MNKDDHMQPTLPMIPIPADLSAFDGTAFSILRPAARALRAAGLDSHAVAMRDRVGDAETNERAVAILFEYVRSNDKEGAS